jgi:hypothetical protein
MTPATARPSRRCREATPLSTQTGLNNRARKGSLWALFFRGGRLAAADYYPSLTDPNAREEHMLGLDRLTMLVTADPTAELDTALNFAAAQRDRARAIGDTDAANRLTRWIDHLLDQRLTFRILSQHRCTPP